MHKLSTFLLKSKQVPWDFHIHLIKHHYVSHTSKYIHKTSGAQTNTHANKLQYYYHNLTQFKKQHCTFRSAPAQKTRGTELQIIITLTEESLYTASKTFCNPLNISFPIAFFASGLSKLTSTIPTITKIKK